MPRRSELKLTKRTVDALEVEEKDALFWDRNLAGFGVRVHATGRKVYVVQSRGPGGPRARDARPARGDVDRGGEETRRPRHRPHQAGRGSDA